LDGSELTGWIDGSRVKKFFARRGEKYDEKTPMPAREEVKGKEMEKDTHEEWEVETVTGRKDIQGKWLYFVKWLGFEKRTWVREEDMDGSRRMIEEWNAAHPISANHPPRK
jgi:hypothetical protein